MELMLHSRDHTLFQVDSPRFAEIRIPEFRTIINIMGMNRPEQKQAMKITVGRSSP
jgi:hypothetical protein